MSTPADARSWFAFDPPTPDSRTALATLIEGDETWVGYAYSGLVQYDYYGQVKTRLTRHEGLPGDTITDLARQGKDLWIGTSDGLACRNEAGAIEVFNNKNGLPDNGVTCLLTIGENLYVGTMKGLACRRGGDFDVIAEAQGLPSPHITALARATNDEVLIGTTKGWARMRGRAIEAHTQVSDGLPFEWITATAYYRYKAASLNAGSSPDEDWIVLGSAGGGLIYFHGGQYTVLRKGDEGPGADWITALAFERENMNLWVGTQDGLAIHGIEDNKWQRFTTQNSGLVNNVIKDISLKVIDDPIKDYEILKGKGQACPCASCTFEIKQAKPKPCKECWKIPATPTPRTLQKLQTWSCIGTQGGANLYYDRRLDHVGQGNFFSYLANNGNIVRGFGVGDLLFVGVYPPLAGGDMPGFLGYFNAPTLKFYGGWKDPPDAQFPMEISAFGISPDGKPMAGGYKVGRGGTAILDTHSDSWTIFAERQGLADPNVTCFLRDQGTVLIGTGGMGNSGSLFRLRDGKIATFPTLGLSGAGSLGMFGSPVTALAAEGEKVFVGTKSSGILVFDGSKWDRIQSLGNANLRSDSIQALATRNGLLYVGTKKGLDVLSKDLNAHVEVSAVGAYANDVQALLFDDAEGDESKLVLWVGTENGILRVSLPGGVMRHGGVFREQRTHPRFPWPSNPPALTAVEGWAWPGNPNAELNDVCPFDGLVGTRVTCLACDDFNLWIGTDNGVTRLRK